MILNAKSTYMWAPPLPLPFRVLGLDNSFTGRRGVSMWNPQDEPVHTITLLHGGPGGGRPGMRTICRPADYPGVWQGATRDAIAEALLILPGTEANHREEVASNWGTGPLWEPVGVTVDGQVVSAHRYRHSDDKWWVVGADLGDIGVCVIGHGCQVGDHGLVTLAPDLPGYTAKPPHPRVANA
ncbi:hypothetical protein AB1207_22280 [Kineococcus endophyticus]|uniref:Uncharacterized protein n=1 Tax=Kineococcus endophyticus TaxID=1181883 RepID=A0ABV3PCX6_9ACTN